jgi:hypothetical protein
VRQFFVSSNEGCALTVTCTFLPNRKLQEDLTDEMVELARQLKESSLMMNQSVQETEKVFFFHLVLRFLLRWHVSLCGQSCIDTATTNSSSCVLVVNVTLFADADP